MRLYKLTDQNGQTKNGTQWSEGSTHTASGKGELCSEGWIHAYTDPLLAVFLNPIHANFPAPQLWEAEGEVGKEDHGLKVGVQSLRTIAQMPLPKVSLEQRVRFAILCALEVHRTPGFAAWAHKWLTGEDRSVKTAEAAEAAVAEAAVARVAACVADAVVVRAVEGAWAAAAVVVRAVEEAWARTKKPFHLAALAASAMEEDHVV